MRKLALMLNYLLNEIVFIIAVILLFMFFWVILLAKW